MNWLDVGLSSGLGVTLAGWLFTAGKSSQKRQQLEGRVESLEDTVCKHEERLDKHDVQYATIDAKLDLLIELSSKDK